MLYTNVFYRIIKIVFNRKLIYWNFDYCNLLLIQCKHSNTFRLIPYITLNLPYPIWKRQSGILTFESMRSTSLIVEDHPLCLQDIRQGLCMHISKWNRSQILFIHVFFSHADFSLIPICSYCPIIRIMHYRFDFYWIF